MSSGPDNAIGWCDRKRSCDRRWVYSIVEQCKRANVDCFVKQLCAHSIIDGGDRPAQFRDRKGSDPSEWPADARVQQFPDGEAVG